MNDPVPSSKKYEVLSALYAYWHLEKKPDGTWTMDGVFEERPVAPELVDRLKADGLIEPVPNDPLQLSWQISQAGRRWLWALEEQDL